MLRLSPL